MYTCVYFYAYEFIYRGVPSEIQTSKVNVVWYQGFNSV